MTAMNLSNATIVSSQYAKGPEAKAIDVLIEEAQGRTGIKLNRITVFPKLSDTVIAVGTIQSLQLIPGISLPDPLPILQPEGYMLKTYSEEHRDIVFIIGADARGVLYGVGKLLRCLRWEDNLLELDDALDIVTAPASAIRGHQLGYRPKNNAFDAWSVDQFDRYIRELALFGANSIEILPPRTDDHPTSPVMKLEPMKMMVKLAEVIDSYGLDTWLWYPNMGDDYSNPDSIRAELAEREEIFLSIPNLKAIFIPGSDPGKLEPEPLFAWTAQIASLLKKHHPKAKIWLSPQVMRYETKKWMTAFYDQVNRKPDWLGGIVFGPHVDVALPTLREQIPTQYPIRRYEDITHTYHCQYPAVEWDTAFVLTLGRESCNPQPAAMKHIHNVLAPYADGTICYSEGINDDVNKFVWLDQEWSPKTAVQDTLRDYAGLFLGSRQAEAVTQGLFALEENWVGPLLSNERVDVTLRQWQQMEQEAAPRMRNHYRFQMHLLRAYFDAYTRRRLIYETELETAAKEMLRSAPILGSEKAIEKAEQILGRAKTELVAEDYHKRCDELADQLFFNIGYQLTVFRHFARSQGRGAFMDAILAPLNDVRWLSVQFSFIREESVEEVRLMMIDRILNRTNPGPAGFYDHLGSYGGIRRVDPGSGWQSDPGYLSSPRIGHSMSLLSMSAERQRKLGGIPLAWVANATVILDTPIIVHYDRLNPSIPYTVKVAYIGDTNSSSTPRDCWARLTAGEGINLDAEVFVESGTVTIRECEIPPEAVSNGKLKLTIERTSGFKRLSVAEIWLMPSRQMEA